MPSGPEMPEDEDDRIGSRPQMFVRLIWIHNDVDGIEIGRAGTVASKNFRRESALQRGKSEDRAVIMPQNKLIQPVTQSTDAVVEDDGVGLTLHS